MIDGLKADAYITMYAFEEKTDYFSANRRASSLLRQLQVALKSGVKCTALSKYIYIYTGCLKKKRYGNSTGCRAS